MVAENQTKLLSCNSVQFLSMATEDNIVSRKLKFKITTKGIRDASEDKSCQDIMKIVIKKGDRSTAGGKKCPEINVPGKQSMPANSCKRKPEASLDLQSGKRQKMDRGLKYHCLNILKELLDHPDGWIFSEPVDPVKLQIPDYFSIITEPMDLGTIKHKLDGNIYSSVEGFASDVRLTFSNAMLYNPPDNRVHQSAKLLDSNFNKKWKLVEAKMKNLDNNIEQGGFDDAEKNGQDIKKNVERNCLDIRPSGLQKGPLRIKLCGYRPLSIEEKRNFRMELVQLLDKKVMGHLQTVFQKLGLADLSKEGLESFINSTGDETLWKLRRDLKVFLDAKAEKARPPKNAQNIHPSFKKPDQKEHCNESIGDRAGFVEAKCPSCCSITCHCQRKIGSQISTSEISSERSSEHDHCGDSKLDSEVKHTGVCPTSSSCVDSDGPGVVLNEENSPNHLTPAESASVEVWNSLNVQMSPQKALRAAMLKSRFADTIFRAKHQAILDNCQKSDPIRMQQEKARLEREQIEEKARIDAQIKAAKAASQREQNDIKMRREKERYAARMALEMMEKTVVMNENIYIMKELEKFGCVYPCARRLEWYGLYIKDDYLKEEEDIALGGEDGEIL